MQSARKVRALVDALLDMDPTWVDLDTYTDEDWELVAKRATALIRRDLPTANAVHPPSNPRTLRRVLANFAGRRRDPQWKRTPTHA